MSVSLLSVYRSTCFRQFCNALFAMISILNTTIPHFYEEYFPRYFKVCIDNEKCFFNHCGFFFCQGFDAEKEKFASLQINNDALNGMFVACALYILFVDAKESLYDHFPNSLQSPLTYSHPITLHLHRYVFN